MSRPKDLPRQEFLELAGRTRRSYPGSTIYFKFSCAHCGARCTLSDANTLYEQGECCKCGKLTKIDKGGFDLHLEIGTK